MATRKVQWVFDVISPFAYLSCRQFEQLPGGIELECIPVLFAGLLGHHGQIGNAEIASKRLFTYRFALWRAGEMGIEMRFPPAHPFNPLAALRLIIAAGSDYKATQLVFDAVWRYGRDLTDPTVIADLAGQLGIADPNAALSDSKVKQRLHENTAWAISKGIFGVPTFVIDNELFWGHDAFEMALDYLQNPDLLQSPEMKALESLPVGIVRKRND
jgi:2-hydroxychromene-2-carboxylate isomerase